MSDLWPLAVYFVLAVMTVVGMLGVSYLLGPRHKERATGQPYESGIVSTGSARLQLSVKYYLIAMFFVIFDLETAYIVTWSVALREVGWAGYVEIVIFVGILLAALAYLWREGALDWRTPRKETANPRASVAGR